MNLPILSQKPAFRNILHALQALQPKPTSPNDSAVELPAAEDDGAVNKFLMSVIMNDMTWLTDLTESDGSTLSAEEQGEVLTNEASKRLSERCGRSAAGEMTRTWIIPESPTTSEIKIELREPPLTGDMLGFKTWGTSYVISRKLDDIGNKHFSHLLGQSPDDCPPVLELGAGTGLVGIAAAAIWKAGVVLTDLEDIQENMRFNIDKNMLMVVSHGGSICGETLDWTKPEDALTYYTSKEFKIVIAADPMYDDEHPLLVAQIVDRFLKAGTESRALVAIPLRDAHTKALAATFASLLGGRGFRTVDQGHEIFKDDDWNTVEEVDVQWTVWCRI